MCCDYETSFYARDVMLQVELGGEGDTYNSGEIAEIDEALATQQVG